SSSRKSLHATVTERGIDLSSAMSPVTPSITTFARGPFHVCDRVVLFFTFVSLNRKFVTMPKLPAPPPCRAQNSFVESFASTMRTEPSASTISAFRMLSQVSPSARDDIPHPPPSVTPPTHTVSHPPPGMICFRASSSLYTV